MSLAMALAAGTRIGPYEISSLLGAGGMGEVYRARDTALRREVAIKVLPEHFAGDAERLTRFQREAEVLASLNHPNIAHIHGLEISGQARGIVMELVEGPTLADRIANRTLSLDETLAITRQIADALETAHEQSIIHRDLKPANIKVRDDGTVKVLDFGLAKVQARDGWAPDSSQSPTVTSAGTREGVILGTAAYLSPEQARGRPLDKRTDIWAFGCVLYEMLTGRSAFAGPTVSDTISAILTREPDWAALPPQTPPNVRRLLHRCLEKDAKRRLRDIGDARFELELPDGRTDVESVPQRERRGWLWTAAVVAVLALLGLAAAVWLPQGVEPTGLSPLARATFSRLTDFDGNENDAAISPDGRFVVFRADRDGPPDVWLSRVGSGRFTNLTQGKEVVSGIVRVVGFTPDVSEIWVGTPSPAGRLRLIPLLGGPSRVFLTGSATTVDWSPDGTKLVYHSAVAGDPMFVADRTGANPRQIYIHPQPGGHNHYPIWSRDGQSIFFVTGNWATSELDVWRIAAAGGTPERLTNHNNDVTYPTLIDATTLLYLSRAEDGSGPWIWALDLRDRTTQRVSFGLEKYTSLSATADGHQLVATVSNPTADLWTVPILDRVAEEAQAQPLPMPTVHALAPRLGPSSMFYLSSLGAGDGLWRYQDGEAVEIWKGADGALLEPPAVSPDGRRVAIVLRRGGSRQLHLIAADGAGLQPLGQGLDVQGAASWSPDGRWIVTGGADATGAGLFKVAVGDGTRVRIVAGPAINPVWSPDGTLIAYAGQVVGQFAPLLAVHPDGAAVGLPSIQVRMEGERVRFTPDGKALIYMTGAFGPQEFRRLDLATKTSRPLTSLKNSATMRTFDLTPDGKQIIFDRIRMNHDLVLIDLPRS